MFSPLFCFEQEKTLKNFSQKLYRIKLKKKKKKQRRKVALGTKLAQILEQSGGTRQVCVSVFFLFWSLYKTNRFHVAVGLFSNRSQRTSKFGKNISDTLTCGSCATSLFWPNFDVLCDLLLNRTTATWNCLRVSWNNLIKDQSFPFGDIVRKKLMLQVMLRGLKGLTSL